ncbi:hypothetical protein GCM10025871_21280 [Deinococcus metallilatus]|nr:hypothetical protein GCM10025871_21280 [Deinococcus metallilatus]
MDELLHLELEFDLVDLELVLLALKFKDQRLRVGPVLAGAPLFPGLLVQDTLRLAPQLVKGVWLIISAHQVRSSWESAWGALRMGGTGQVSFGQDTASDLGEARA